MGDSEWWCGCMLDTRIEPSIELFLWRLRGERPFSLEGAVGADEISWSSNRGPRHVSPVQGIERAASQQYCPYRVRC